LTTAKYGQLQQAQKQQYRLTLKNKRKHNKGTIRNFKDINQYESINPFTQVLDNSWRANYR
jgi:ribosomal 30S subunit maturation factor RimM